MVETSKSVRLVKKYKTGSITVYLSLTMLVMLALLSAMVYSARMATCRVALAGGVEQGLFSAFAGYQRELYDAYGLLFLDLGDQNGTVSFAETVEAMEKDISYVIDPDQGIGRAAGKSILDIDLSSTEITAYTLATDVHGAAFYRQITEVMKAGAGAAAADYMKSRFSEQQYQQMESVKNGYSKENADQYYSQPSEDEVIENPVNPSPSIARLRKSGVLQLVVPNAASLSSAAVDRSNLPSQRTLQQGMGIMPHEDTSLTDKALLIAYLTNYFSNYTRRENAGKSLAYQVEYVIGGKDSDVDNLRVVAGQLLAMREASNMVFLMMNPIRSQEADILGLSIATALLNPELAPIFALAIKAAWSFAEAICDVRELLDGGKIALMKTDASWQTPLSQIALIMQSADTLRHSSPGGLTYTEYLDMLLLTKSDAAIVNALMDLVEMNICQTAGCEGFRLDCCVDSMEVLLRADLMGRELSISRSYGYDMSD